MGRRLRRPAEAIRESGEKIMRTTCISKAFASSWQSFGEFWQDVAVFIVSALPAIITLAVIVLVIVVTVLAATRKKKK